MGEKKDRRVGDSDMDKRIAKLRERLFSIKPGICPERARYFTQSMKETEGQFIALRRAKGFANVLRNMTIVVEDDELIAGNQASSIKAAPIFPEYSSKWIIEEFEGNPYYMDQRPGDRFYFTKEVQKEITDILQYWKGKSLFENYWESLPEDCKNAWEIGVTENLWVSNAGYGNVILDFPKVLDKGLYKVIDEIKDRISSLDLRISDNVRKKWYLESMVIADQAVIDFAERIANQCAKAAGGNVSKERKAELLRMEENLRNVPGKPARNFWEAVQCIWILLVAQHLESNGHANSIGRLDQYLYPYYKRDIDENKLTKEEALVILESFFIKTNELNKLRSWADSEFYLGYQMFVNVSIAGQKQDGTDAVNDVTYLLVDACKDLKLITPSVSVKYADCNPPEFVDYVLQAILEHKGGQPAFYNDKAFMRILENMGVTHEDAVDWANVGCIEAGIPGKWDFAAKGPTLNLAKVIELAYNGGRDPKTGRLLIPVKEFAEFTDMNEFMEAVKTILKYIFNLQEKMENINDEFHRMLDLNPFRSSLIDDCINRGCDLIEGGSKYSADGGPIGGINTAGDSLAAINYLIYDKQILTADQLKHALDTNFEDGATMPTGEEIRSLIITKTPKFGNDDDRADSWCYELEDFIGSYYNNQMKNSRYGKGPIPGTYSVDLSPVTGNIPFGMCVGATPNGRKAGEALNNGISPCNGCEMNGPTAVINSLGKMPSQWFQKGAIFNMRLERWALSDPDVRKRVAALVKVLFDKYGVHIQFNVIDNATLIEAQKNPDQYKDLMVRISGYSALFAPLAPQIQNDLIEREIFNM